MYVCLVCALKTVSRACCVVQELRCERRMRTEAEEQLRVALQVPSPVYPYLGPYLAPI
jgi:hypothetical protein